MPPTAREQQRQAHDNARTEDERAAGLHPSSWPLDADGDPMVEIAFQAHELIGLKEFSNITVGPAVVRCLVSVNRPNPFTDTQKRNLVNALNEVAELVEADVIARQRAIALNTIDPAKRHDG